MHMMKLVWKYMIILVWEYMHNTIYIHSTACESNVQGYIHYMHNKLRMDINKYARTAKHLKGPRRQGPLLIAPTPSTHTTPMLPTTGCT